MRPHSRNFLGRPSKIFWIIPTILTIILMFYYLYWKPSSRLIQNNQQIIYNIDNHVFNEFKYSNDQKSVFTGEKIVHLDLKGAPPKITYYQKLFQLLSKLGATGVLMEYEDMFPYSTNLVKNVSALNAYTLEDIKYINELAEENHLKLIPLIQTFGHLEFLLKLNEFKEYREIIDYPQVICPTHDGTINILFEMIEQIIENHPQSNYIHIGADEVYHLGVCDRCLNYMNKNNVTKNMLFLNHINTIANKVHKKHPNLTILMWDDEFRSFSLKDLRKGQLHKIIQPVVWKYTKDVYEELGPSLWDMYSEVFPNLWIGSAFKGATASNQIVNDVTHYLQNHRSWLTVYNEYKKRINFQGIILTGWQRYDHFAILCELLPVSLPSLAMCLRLILGYNDSPLSPPVQVAKSLGCEQAYALIGPAFGSPKCSYSGADILENVLRLQQLKQEYEQIRDDSVIKGWMNEYNIAHSFSNPEYVQTATAPLNRIKYELNIIDRDITIALNEVYDNFTIIEWKQTHIKPFEKIINDMWDARERILVRDNWPRRPLISEENKDEF